MEVSQILLWLLLNPVCREVLLLLLKLPPVRRSLLESLLSLIFINMLVLVSEKVVFVRLSVIQFLLHVRQLVWGVGSVLAHFYRRLVFFSQWSNLGWSLSFFGRNSVSRLTVASGTGVEYLWDVVPFTETLSSGPFLCFGTPKSTSPGLAHLSRRCLVPLTCGFFQRRTKWLSERKALSGLAISHGCLMIHYRLCASGHAETSLAIAFKNSCRQRYLYESTTYR